MLENPPQAEPPTGPAGMAIQGGMVGQAPDMRPPGFKETCMVCHEDDVIRGQHLTRAQWDREITKMTGWGAPVNTQNRDMILNYLAQAFGKR